MKDGEGAPRGDQGEPALGGTLPVDPMLLDELTRLNNEMAALHRELAKQKAHLERLNRLKDDFLGMAAHDMRTPLNVLVMSAAVLEEDAGEELTPEVRVFVRTVRMSAMRMLRLVNQLVDVAAIETGRLRLDLQSCDVLDMLRDVMETHKVIASPKRIEIELIADAGACPVLADPERLHQAVSNLVGNAIKFTPEEGRVQVAVSGGATEVMISVRDTGVGIAPENMPHLFTPFAIRAARPESPVRVLASPSPSALWRRMPGASGPSRSLDRARRSTLLCRSEPRPGARRPTQHPTDSPAWRRCSARLLIRRGSPDMDSSRPPAVSCRQLSNEGRVWWHA